MHNLEDVYKYQWLVLMNSLDDTDDDKAKGLGSNPPEDTFLTFKRNPIPVELGFVTLFLLLHTLFLRAGILLF